MKNKLKKAFTLVELLIFMGLMSVLLVMMTQIFVYVLDARADAEALSSVEQDGNYIMARFMYDVGRSTGIVSPSAPSGANPPPESNTLQLVIDGVSRTYTLNGDNLEYNDGTNIDRMNGFNTQVTNLVFRRIGAGDAKDTIQIDFTLNSRNLRHAGVETKSYQTTAASRQ